MCEYCIEPEPPRTPEQEAKHQALLSALRRDTERELRRKGLTLEQLMDPGCHPTRWAQARKAIVKYPLLAWLGFMQAWCSFGIALLKTRIAIRRFVTA